MGRNAQYRIEHEDAETVVIRDLGGAMALSITNDAERVVKELHDMEILNGRKLMYFDSYGELSELKHDGNGVFLDFGPDS